MGEARIVSSTPQSEVRHSANRIVVEMRKGEGRPQVRYALEFRWLDAYSAKAKSTSAKEAYGCLDRR